MDTVQPRASRIFDRTVMAVGVALALFSATISVAGGLDFPPAIWLAAPLIGVMARFPLIFERPSGAIEIGFESCVLVFLVTLLEPHDAMVVWATGTVISQAMSNFRKVAKIFNMGVTLVGGAAAIAIVDLLRGNVRATPHELAAVALGCTAYFLLDYAISEVSIALEEGVPVHRQLRQPDVAIALACIVAVDSLGYLAALVARTMPVWSVTLLAVPIVTLLVAVKSVARGRETARRMGVLFDVSTQVHALQTESGVLAAMESGGRRLLKGSRLEMRSEPPGVGEVGTRVNRGTDQRWLVTPGRRRTRATPASDQQNLDALALVGDEALARLHLTREMTHLAQHDALTDLVNRASFLRQVDAALASCRMRPGQVAVLFCDLDGFKTVNDWFGHAAGDALLVEVAHTLRDCIGRRGTVARLGGDEFAVLVEAAETVDDLRALTDGVLEAADQRYEVGGRCVEITTSVGVAFSDGAHSADQLIRNADIAMYEAKFAGRNRVVEYHPDLGRERVRSFEQAEALRQALEDRELTVVYQPVVQSSTDRITGIEALARWTLNGQAVPPDVFIRVAEEAGLTSILGELVLEMVAADAPAMRAAFSGELFISVNVSAQQLLAPGFVASVLRARDALGELALVLEITERQVVGDDPMVSSVIGQLEANGIRFALDDFGIGYSSIGYLQQLAVHVLKTDRLFSAHIDTDPRSMKLLVSMVEMGRALGLDVVIEGIERAAQVDELRRHVTFSDNLFFQGYLLAVPANVDETVRQLESAEKQPVLRAV
ncbi:hypothetical protein BH18ACT8_BH18ACT8_02320 [soil metagenome]